MIPDPKFTSIYSETSPVTNRIIISPDMESRGEDLVKINAYKKELGYENDQEINLGDWTDHGKNPLEVIAKLKDLDHILVGNRDLNFMRFLYESDPAYIQFTYETLQIIKADRNKYKIFFDDKGNLKSGPAFLKAAEECALEEVRYKTKSGSTIPLAWIDPAKPDFTTWVDKATARINTDGQASDFSQLDDLAKQVLYIQYQNEHTRGAPDAFMYWAIAFATRVDAGATQDFSKTAFELYSAVKAIKDDNVEYRKAYLKLRAHLNIGFKYAKADNANILNYSNSFEEYMVEFYKKPTVIMDLIRSAEIARTIGFGKNKVLLIHGGITIPDDLSLPDGQEPAANIDEFITRFNHIKTRFFQLYDKPRTAEEDKEFITLARGFAFMALPRQAVANTKLHDLRYMKGGVIAVENGENIADTVKPIYENAGYVAQINGHTPANQLFARKLFDGSVTKLGIDTTYNNAGQAVTLATVETHTDDARTIAVHAKDKAGKSRSIELGTYDKDGARIWPADANTIIQQKLMGEVLDLDLKEIENTPDMVEINKLTGSDKEGAMKLFLKDWRVQYLEGDNVTLHKGGYFTKQDGNRVFFNSTVNLNWKTVANKINPQFQQQIYNTIFLAGTHMTSDKEELSKSFRKKMSQVKTIDELANTARLFNVNLDVHKHRTWDGFWASPAFETRWVGSLKRSTSHWLEFRYDIAIRAGQLFEDLAKAADDKVVQVSAIKEFDKFLIAKYGNADLINWHQDQLPSILSDLIYIKLNAATSTIGTDVSTELALGRADELLKTINDYGSCLKENMKGMDFIDVTPKKDFYGISLYKARIALTLQLKDEMPVKNSIGITDAEQVALSTYIDKLNILREHALFKEHRDWYGYGRTGAQIRIDDLVSEAKDRLSELSGVRMGFN